MGKAVKIPPIVANQKYIDTDSPSGFSFFGLQAFGEQGLQLNGVIIPEAAPAAPSQFVSAYDPTTGSFTQTQPAFTDVAGVVSSQQLPAATNQAGGALQLAGDISGTASAPKVVSTSLLQPLPVAQGGSGSAAPSLVAGTNITITGQWPNQTVNAASGITATIPLAKLTAGGANGSLTFTQGILTTFTAPS